MTLGPLDLRDMVFAAAAGTAIAAACGLRAFLPLLALGLGVHFGFLRVAHGGEWIGTTPAIVTLVWATVLELAADKVPAIDHALDMIATVLRPLAAATAAWCTFVGIHPALGVAAAMLYKFLYGVIGLWQETPIFFRTKKESTVCPSQRSFTNTLPWRGSVSIARREGRPATGRLSSTRMRSREHWEV